jgi:hypothetical protein
LMEPRHRICVQLICLPSVLHVGAIISRPSPQVLQSVRRRSQKRKTNEEDNPAVGRLLEPPSPDRLNTLSPTPPLEMAGPPLHLQPRHWLRPPSPAFPSSAREPRTTRPQHPCRRGRAVEPSEPPWGATAPSNLHLPRGDPTPSLRSAGCAPPVTTAPRVNRSG